MATPLMWQACRFSNTVYGTILGYNLPLQIDPNTNTFRVERQYNQLKKFYFSVFIILLIFVSLLDIIFQIRVLKSIEVPFNMLIFHVAASFMCVFCISLLYVFVHFKDVIWDHYFNMLILFGGRLLPKNKSETKNVKVKTPNFGILTVIGNNKVFINLSFGLFFSTVFSVFSF